MNLFEHQRSALDRTAGRNRVAYFHDMGLGKTFTGAEKMIHIGNRVNLLICQKSKIADWVDHFVMNYAMNHCCMIYDLTNKTDFKMFLETDFVEGDHVVGVINYELAWRRKDLRKLTGFTLMLDESSLIQNKQAKQTKFVLSLSPSSVILLSGTPTAGKYENLWTQAHLLGWPISEDLFLRQYVNWKLIDVCGTKHKIVDANNPYKNVERLREKLREYGADFLKTDECFDLPNQLFQRIVVPAPKEYRVFAKKKIVEIAGRTLIGDTEFSERLHKRELCGIYSEEKLNAFRDLIQSTNDRLIVFYNFTAELEAMAKVLDELRRNYSIVNGCVKALTAYETDESSITLVQYQAGAMGLNLQKANKVVYFTLPDGRSDLFEQSKKRIHRIGQKSTCFYYVLTCSETIEEEIELTLNVRREYTDKLF